MSIEVEEAIESRKYSSQRRNGVTSESIECVYFIFGTDDTAVAKAYGPQDGDAYPDARVQSVVVSRSASVEKVGGPDGGMCKVMVSYGPPEQAPPPSDEPEYELSLMAETVHIESAISQDHYPPASDAVGTAIGVDADKVQGVDVYVPKSTYKEVKYVSSLSRQFKQRLSRVSGCINDRAWKDWAAGEVLFLGATATRKGQGKWKLEFNFSIQQSLAQSIDTDSGLQEFTKVGWDYIWIEKARRKSSDGSQVMNTNAAVHVAKVYPAEDFSLLGLGT